MPRITRNEIAAGIPMRLQTVCGRTRELVLDGKLKDSGKRRDGGAVMVIA